MTARRKYESKRVKGAFLSFILHLFFVVVIFSVSIPSTPAWGIVGDSEGPFGLDGSLRTIAAGIDYYNFEPFFGEDNEEGFFSQTLLRLTAAGRPKDWLVYEIHALQSLNVSSSDTDQGADIFNLAPRKTRYRVLDENWDWLEEGEVAAALWFDRFNTKASYEWADFTVGRQVITFGKAYFWNPLDVFLPFDSRQFDRDYKAGVDAVRVDISLGDFSGINFVGALGREISLDGDYIGREGAFDASWYGSALLARLFTNQAGWDVALQGGKIYGGYQIGGGAVGEIGPIEVRGEAAYLFAEKRKSLPSPFEGDLLEDHWTAVMGLGHRFENTLNIEIEYLYNDAGDPDNLDAALIRSQNGTSLHLGRHILGIMGHYEFLPVLTGQLAWLFSFSDTSSQIQPGLTYSVADETDLLLGAIVNMGEDPEGDSALTPDLQSEFGTYPDIYYLELKTYF